MLVLSSIPNQWIYIIRASLEFDQERIQILRVLFEHAGNIVARDDLMRELWNSDFLLMIIRSLLMWLDCVKVGRAGLGRIYRDQERDRVRTEACLIGNNFLAYLRSRSRLFVYLISLTFLVLLFQFYLPV